MTALAMFLLFAAGCQTHPSGIVDTLTPETISVGLTAPNMIGGPILVNAHGDTDRHDHLGQIGVMVSASYRLKPLHISRDEPQPVRVVAASPVRDLAHPIPTPVPDHGN